MPHAHAMSVQRATTHVGAVSALSLCRPAKQHRVLRRKPFRLGARAIVCAQGVLSSNAFAA